MQLIWQQTVTREKGLVTLSQSLRALSSCHPWVVPKALELLLIECSHQAEATIEKTVIYRIDYPVLVSNQEDKQVSSRDDEVGMQVRWCFATINM